MMSAAPFGVTHYLCTAHRKRFSILWQKTVCRGGERQARYNKVDCVGGGRGLTLATTTVCPPRNSTHEEDRSIARSARENRLSSRKVPDQEGILIIASYGNQCLFVDERQRGHLLRQYCCIKSELFASPQHWSGASLIYAAYVAYGTYAANEI